MSVESFLEEKRNQWNDFIAQLEIDYETPTEDFHKAVKDAQKYADLTLSLLIAEEDHPSEQSSTFLELAWASALDLSKIHKRHDGLKVLMDADALYLQHEPVFSPADQGLVNAISNLSESL